MRNNSIPNRRDIAKLSSLVSSLSDPEISKIHKGKEKLKLYKQAKLSNILFFQEYLNSNILYENDFFEIGDKFNKISELSVEQFTSFFSHKILSQLPKYDNFDRDDNIEIINARQKKDLFWSGKWNVADFDASRTLIFYLRQQEMPMFEFHIMYQAIKLLIATNKTKLFNNLSVVSRSTQNIPNYISNDYNDVSGNNFREFMTYQANAIHFTQGTLYENRWMKTTTHIAGKSLLNRVSIDNEFNKKIGDNYVKLDLNFADRQFKNTDCLDISQIIEKVIESVLLLENRILGIK